MTGRTSLTVHQNVSQLTARDGPHPCTAVLRPLDRACRAPVAHQDHLVSRPMPGPRATRYKSGTDRTTQRWPTATTITQRSHRPPPIPTVEALASVPSAALHQQVARPQPKPALAGRADLRDGQPQEPLRLSRGGQGVASHRSPPRATTRQPGGRARRRTHRLGRGLPPGCRVVGLRQIDGTPHEPQRARSSAITSPH
jgi:hypothetical protein